MFLARGRIQKSNTKPTQLVFPPVSLDIGKLNNLVMRTGFGRGAGRRGGWCCKRFPVSIHLDAGVGFLILELIAATFSESSIPALWESKAKPKIDTFTSLLEANEWLLGAGVALLSSLGSHITRKNWPLAPGPRPTSPTLPNLPQSF